MAKKKNAHSGMKHSGPGGAPRLLHPGRNPAQQAAFDKATTLESKFSQMIGVGKKPKKAECDEYKDCVHGSAPNGNMHSTHCADADSYVKSIR